MNWTYVVVQLAAFAMVAALAYLLGRERGWDEGWDQHSLHEDEPPWLEALKLPLPGWTYDPTLPVQLPEPQSFEALLPDGSRVTVFDPLHPDPAAPQPKKGHT